MGSARTRKSVLDRLDEETRKKVEAAIHHDLHSRASAIFNRFELERFGVNRGSFANLVRRLRQLPTSAGATRPGGCREAGSVAAAKSTYVALMLRILHVVEELLARDDLGDLSRLASILQAINSSIRLMFAESTDSRAEALHRFKLKQLKDDLHHAVSERAEAQSCMTEAEARDMIDRIMRGDPPPARSSG